MIHLFPSFACDIQYGDKVLWSPLATSAFELNCEILIDTQVMGVDIPGEFKF